MQIRNAGPHVRNSADPLLWGLAALLSLGSLWLPQSIALQSDDTAYLIVVESGLFLSGAFLGSLRPRRVWRWALASFIVLALRDMALAAGSHASSQFTALAALEHLWTHSGPCFLQALPVLFGGYLGSCISKAGLD